MAPCVGCEEEPSEPGAPEPLTVVHVTEDVTAPTTWADANLYVIDNSIAVTAALTIEPGTIVKLEEGTSISVNTNGSIIADAASASTPCVFTSVKDDARGGDTNGDNAATAPARGDWGYVAVRDDGTIFNHCRFLYGGANMPYTGTLVLMDDCAATVTNCTFAHNQGGKLTDLRAAALNASSAGAATVITGNTFFDNDMPLVTNGVLDIDDSNVFHAVVDNDTVTNTYNGIFWGGSYLVEGDVSWTNTDVPYVIINNPLGVAAGSSLTLGDNVILKLDMGQRIGVSGVLTADATAGILFTSIRDDSAGGDTNGDAAATAPAPGDWGFINLDADGSLLNRCRFSFGGSARPYHGALAVAHDSTATITNCTFAHNAGGTLADNRAAALNLAGAVAGTVITGNLFYANDMPLVISGAVDIDDSNVFHYLEDGEITPRTNGLNGIFINGAVDGSVTWSNTEVPYVMYETVLIIQDTGSLTLGDDVVLKLDAGSILLNGSLNEGTGNYFTSLMDDTLAGDTNGDGSATAPADGDWLGVNICQGGPCSWAPWGNILYAQYP